MPSLSAVASMLRTLGVGVLAGIITGLLSGGLGSRVVMRVVALSDPARWASSPMPTTASATSLWRAPPGSWPSPGLFSGVAGGGTYVAMGPAYSPYAMIRGYFAGPPGRLLPFVITSVSIASLNVAGEVHFLVDTGADSTVLAPRNARRFQIEVAKLPAGPPSSGVGGTTLTVSVEAAITLDRLAFTIPLRILAPVSRQRQALRFIPSLLGRDILSRFAVYIDQAENLVLLLEPEEAAVLRRHVPFDGAPR